MKARPEHGKEDFFEMYLALVHTDINERFVILLKNGISGGTALLSFIQNLDFYLDYSEEKLPPEEAIREELIGIVRWFSIIESNSETHLKILTKPLLESLYVGEYSEGEYIILAEKETSIKKKEMWGRMYAEVHSRWTDLEILLDSVRNLYKLVSDETVEKTWWCNTENTLPEFLGLIEALELALQRTAEKVVLQFL